MKFELYSSLYLSGLNILVKRLLDYLLNYRYNGYDESWFHKVFPVRRVSLRAECKTHSIGILGLEYDVGTLNTFSKYDLIGKDKNHPGSS